MNKHLEAEWRFPAKTAWAIFAAMIFGNFMAILDIEIVASSLNEVQAGMSASRYEVTWVQTCLEWQDFKILPDLTVQEANELLVAIVGCFAVVFIVKQVISLLK